MKGAPRSDLRQQLAGLKERLAQRSREDAQRRAEQAEALRRERAEREQFARAVGPVAPLPDPGRVARAIRAPEPVPRQRQADEARALAASLSDDFDVGTLLDTDDGLSFRRPGIGPDVLTRLRRGGWSIQRQIDLHGMTRETAREALAQFIRQAARDGLRCVRVVHGKGNGSPGREPVLKAKVRAWLVQKQEVIAFAQASAADGGHGALLVVLRGD
ncbi:MAG TPA: Smr/MutS family protein [Burkholderiaceae bacterium]|nr:Smr/MutS family protein [Burkholderiaceae bacterium]